MSQYSAAGWLLPMCHHAPVALFGPLVLHTRSGGIQPTSDGVLVALEAVQDSDAVVTDFYKLRLSLEAVLLVLVGDVVAQQADELIGSGNLLDQLFPTLSGIDQELSKQSTGLLIIDA